MIKRQVVSNRQRMWYNRWSDFTWTKCKTVVSDQLAQSTGAAHRRRPIPNTLIRLWHLLPIMLLWVVACTAGVSSSATVSPISTELISVTDLLMGTPTSAPISVVGYLYALPDHVVLTDGLTFSAAPQPLPLDPDPAQQIWFGSALDPPLASELTQQGEVRYGIVQAQGRLEGSGQFGPAGKYRYQFTPTSITRLSPLEVTIAELLARSDAYANQLVRVHGALLTSENTALLVSQLGAGGVPASDSLQLKLPVPVRDTALLDKLIQVDGHSVSFGPVQVEGIWRGTLLHPLSIIATENL